MGCFLIFAMMFTYRGRELVTLPKASGRERLRAFVSAIPGLLMPVIILGGIYGGFFTPTEAAAVASIYGIIVGLATRKLKPADLWPILKDSVSQTAVVMLIVGTASLFSYALTLTGIASDASAALISICGDSKFLFLLIVNIILLIAGCFIDANSAMYIIVPILLPVARALGIDLVHLGCVMVFNLAVGLVTPARRRQPVRRLRHREHQAQGDMQGRHAAHYRVDYRAAARHLHRADSHDTAGPHSQQSRRLRRRREYPEYRRLNTICEPVICPPSVRPSSATICRSP